MNYPKGTKKSLKTCQSDTPNFSLRTNFEKEEIIKNLSISLHLTYLSLKRKKSFKICQSDCT
jgi:hypothetical protein